MKAVYTPYDLIFKNPAGTSRGILKTKLTYFLKIQDADSEYIGECAFFKGLSADNEAEYENRLRWVCENIDEGKDFLLKSCLEFPSIQFGIEQVFMQLENKKANLYFPSDFTQGIRGIQINGLIWMGSLDFMREQIQEKLKNHFHCIKLKIGVDWNGEYEILKNLRNEFSSNQLELRVDANGGFTYNEAKLVLEQLAQLDIHSIEQPIRAGQIDNMIDLCKNSPIPIALDEELIGKFHSRDKVRLIQQIQPQYIILKPSLIGGWQGSEEWIEIAKNHNSGWWITSALESNIGLNAIAQWTATMDTNMPQGLGTGGLFTNNFPSNLEIRGEKLFYNP